MFFKKAGDCVRFVCLFAIITHNKLLEKAQKLS